MTFCEEGCILYGRLTPKDQFSLFSQTKSSILQYVHWQCVTYNQIIAQRDHAFQPWTTINLITMLHDPIERRNNFACKEA